MAFLRRVAMVLIIAAIAALVVRMKGRVAPRSMDGGWRPVTPREE